MLSVSTAKGSFTGMGIQYVQKGITLNRWQTIGTVLVVVFTVVGGLGAAAQGFTVDHQWSCQVGLLSTMCPQSSVSNTQPPFILPTTTEQGAFCYSTCK